MLVILAAIDAAFSGDWSRIGVLSKEAELGLRPLLGLLGLFHVVCGSVTFLDASRKGYNPVPQTLKAGPDLHCTLTVSIKHPASSPSLLVGGVMASRAQLFGWSSSGKALHSIAWIRPARWHVLSVAELHNPKYGLNVVGCDGRQEHLRPLTMPYLQVLAVGFLATVEQLYKDPTE